MKNALIIDPKDTVVVAIEPIKKGEPVIVAATDNSEERFTATDDIIIYHKIARRAIKKGEKICKYGEHIGEALRDIKQGEHIHTHNVESVRENLDI